MQILKNNQTLSNLVARLRPGGIDESNESTQSRYRDYGRILELLVFALLAPVVGLLVFPHDPLGIKSGFPWAVVGPVVFAARYGSSWGVACAASAALVMLMPHAVYAAQFSMVIALAVGTVVLSLVVGDSATTWRKRSGQAEAENQYLRHRLTEFSKDYHVLKVSHGQLEEFMAGQRLSLRQALQQLKPVMSSTSDGMIAGSELMAIFSQFCSIQVAGLYSMKSPKLPESKPIAVHGNMDELPMFDPLLKMAIKEQKLVSVKLRSLANDHHDSGLLAVVPIADSQNHLHGVLAIRDMHFMAFQQENLNILSLLGGYIGDMLSRSKGLGNSRAAWFLAEMDTALRFARTNSVQSSLLCLQLKRFGQEKELAEYISSNIRSLDASWLPPTKDGSYAVVILLPLIGESQSQAYMRRVAQSVMKDFNLDLERIVESTRIMQIKRSDNRASCLNFIQPSTGFSKVADTPDGDNSGGSDSGIESVA